MQNNINNRLWKQHYNSSVSLYSQMREDGASSRAPFTIISSLMQAGYTTGKGGGKKTWHLITNYDTISL